MVKEEDLRKELWLLDNSKRDQGRVIALERRINPAGVMIAAYWAVRNVRTKRESVIREDRLLGKRFTKVMMADD